jgi:hypothetical protein
MDALEKVGDHVPFTLTTGQQHACHAVPRTHIWKDVLGQVITVPLRDSVVVVMGECLLRLLSGGGATHIVRAQARLLLFHKAFTLAPCRVIRTRPIRSICGGLPIARQGRQLWPRRWLPGPRHDRRYCRPGPPPAGAPPWAW